MYTVYEINILHQISFKVLKFRSKDCFCGSITCADASDASLCSDNDIGNTFEFWAWLLHFLLDFGEWTNWDSCVPASPSTQSFDGIRRRTRTCDGGNCAGNVGIDESSCRCEKAFDNNVLTDCTNHFLRVEVHGKDHRECERLCRETENCVAFVWAGSDSHISYCHLQNAEDRFISPIFSV